MSVENDMHTAERICHRLVMIWDANSLMNDIFIYFYMHLA